MNSFVHMLLHVDKHACAHMLFHVCMSKDSCTVSRELRAIWEVLLFLFHAIFLKYS